MRGVARPNCGAFPPGYAKGKLKGGLQHVNPVSEWEEIKKKERPYERGRLGGNPTVESSQDTVRRLDEGCV